MGRLVNPAPLVTPGMVGCWVGALCVYWNIYIGHNVNISTPGFHKYLIYYFVNTLDIKTKFKRCLWMVFNCYNAANNRLSLGVFDFLRNMLKMGEPNQTIKIQHVLEDIYTNVTRPYHNHTQILLKHSTLSWVIFLHLLKNLSPNPICHVQR